MPKNKKKPKYLPMKERITKPFPVTTLNIMAEAMTRRVKFLKETLKNSEVEFQKGKSNDIAKGLGMAQSGIDIAIKELDQQRFMIKRLLADKFNPKP